MPNIGERLTKANGEYEWNGVAWTRRISSSGLTPEQQASLAKIAEIEERDNDQDTFLSDFGFIRKGALVIDGSGKRIGITEGVLARRDKTSGATQELKIEAAASIRFNYATRLGRLNTGLDGTDLSSGTDIVEIQFGYHRWDRTVLENPRDVGTDKNDGLPKYLFLNPEPTLIDGFVDTQDANNFVVITGSRVETTAGNARIQELLQGNGRGPFSPPAEYSDWIRLAQIVYDEDAGNQSYIVNGDYTTGGGRDIASSPYRAATEQEILDLPVSGGEVITGRVYYVGDGTESTNTISYKLFSIPSSATKLSECVIAQYSPSSSLLIFNTAADAIGQTIAPGEMLTYGKGTNGVNQIWWNHSDAHQTFATEDFTNFTSVKGGGGSDLEDKQLTDGSTYNISNDLSEDGHVWYKSFNGQDLTVIFEANTPADIFRVDGVGQAGPVSLTGKKFLALRSGSLVEVLTFGGIRFFDAINDADNETFSDGEIVRTGWINEMQPYSGLWQFADGAGYGDYSIANNSTGYFNLINGNVTYLTFPQDFGAQEQAFFDQANQGNASEFEIPLYYTEYNLRRHPQSASRLTFDIPTLAPIAADDFGYHKYLRDKRTGAVVEITDSATGVIFDEVDLSATAFGTTSQVWQATAGTFSITQAGTYDIDINIVAALMLGGESSASSGTGGRIELRSADGATVYESVNFGEEHHRLEDRAANLDEIPYSAGFRFLELQPGAYQFYYFSADGDGAGDRHTQSISGYARIKGFVGDTTTPTYAHFTFASSGENGFAWADEISSNTFNHIANNGTAGITLSNGKYKVEYSAQKQTNSGTSVVNMRLNGANRYTGIATGPNAGASLTDVIDATTASQTLQFIRSASSGQGNTNAQLLITKIGG